MLSEAAIRLGLTGDALYDNIGVVWEALKEGINTRLDGGNTPIPVYNDSYDTTFEDVTTLLDDAIQSCDA